MRFLLYLSFSSLYSDTDAGKLSIFNTLLDRLSLIQDLLFGKPFQSP